METTAFPTNQPGTPGSAPSAIASNEPPRLNPEHDYHSLNAKLNLYGSDGQIQFEADVEAARQFFVNHVNPNTVSFNTLQEKIDYLVTEGYYEKETIDQYRFEFIKSLFQKAYAHNFRFPTFLGAFKYYTSYTLKTFDGKRYLERFEDRVCMVALYLGRGDETLATDIMEEIITGRYQPATPTFLNAGKKARGEMVSCFLVRIEDNMESIARGLNSALQLSKRGGGVALLLTNLREAGAPIKRIQNQSSGVVPVMKMLEDAFSYANQLGARQGAGAVYLNAFHPDIMSFLDTKRENADEKIRIKTLSLGVVIPDIAFELAKNKEPMYLFSPYDIERVYGVPFSEISVTEKYRELVDNPQIHKKQIDARKFFQTLAEIQFESGYPYILYEDTVNRANPIDGRIVMSNLCSEILQVSEASELNPDLSYQKVGKDISCNLGSMNIAKTLDSPDFEQSIRVAIRALTAVSDLTNVECVPTIQRGNAMSHAVGLGAMNLHGCLARHEIFYGSPEGLDFTNMYFYATAFYALKASHELAVERGQRFEGFERSQYATGEYFEKYINETWEPKTAKVREIFAQSSVKLPTTEDWRRLAEAIQRDGMYNQNLQAIPPTGSISYINNSTASIHPVASKIEIRKEGKIGRVYYPAPYMTNDNLEYYQDAYEIGYEKIIDTYAEATQHVDQGLSLTLFFPDTITTRDVNKAQIYAWRKGIKSLYYIRLRQAALEGTEVEGCVSCML